MMSGPRAVQGYLSVFLSLILMIVLSLCLVLIEGTRQNTVRLEAECIMDMGMNSILAEYHREVFEQYGLFYIDASYGTDYPSYYITEAHLREYLQKNTGQGGIFQHQENGMFLPGVYMDLLELTFPEVRITGVSLATDNGGYPFQRQAVAVMENRFGGELIEELLSWIHVVEENNLLESTLEGEMAALERELSALKGKKQLDDKQWISVELENPAAELLEIRRRGILRWVVKNEETISAKGILPEQYVSYRYGTGDINTGNMASKETLSLYERLIFQEYVLQYGGCYTNVKENAGLDYQIEYLLFGTGSDTENLRKTAAAICGMREVANMIYLMGASEKREMVKGAAALLAAALLVPEAEAVFEAILLIAWSFWESMQDTKIIMEGGRVPLLKDEDTWNCSLDNVFDLHAGSEEEARGLTYRDYLRIFLYFAELERITYRFMDLMEMDIRRTEGNEFFRMDGCIDYVEAEVAAASGYGYQYHLKHAKGYR